MKWRVGPVAPDEGASVGSLASWDERPDPGVGPAPEPLCLAAFLFETRPIFLENEKPMIGRPRVYTLLSTAVMGLAAIGCSGGIPTDDLPREAIAGTVTMDGQPLPAGVILFSPEGKPGEVVASASGQIENGEFSIPRERGPVPGNYKVSISHTDQPEGHVKIQLKKPSKNATSIKEMIPAKYNSKTELKETIPKGGKRDLKYDLLSK
jgi:hypothetical protein